MSKARKKTSASGKKRKAAPDAPIPINGMYCFPVDKSLRNKAGWDTGKSGHVKLGVDHQIYRDPGFVCQLVGGVGPIAASEGAAGPGPAVRPPEKKKAKAKLKEEAVGGGDGGAATQINIFDVKMPTAGTTTDYISKIEKQCCRDAVCKFNDWLVM